MRDRVGPAEQSDVCVPHRHKNVKRNQQQVVQHNSDRHHLQNQNYCDLFMRISVEFQQSIGPHKRRKYLEELQEQVYDLVCFVVGRMHRLVLVRLLSTESNKTGI